MTLQFNDVKTSAQKLCVRYLHFTLQHMGLATTNLKFLTRFDQNLSVSQNPDTPSQEAVHLDLFPEQQKCTLPVKTFRSTKCLKTVLFHDKDHIVNIILLYVPTNFDEDQIVLYQQHHSVGIQCIWQTPWEYQC